MNEAETRAEHIDLAQKTSGWRVVQGSHIRCGDMSLVSTCRLNVSK